MAHECRCHRESPADLPGSLADLSEKIGDLVRRDPGVLEVLRALGINHCCGAHLTLAEAAAAAGVCRGALLDALAGRAHQVLDVRGLEPPQPMVRVLEVAAHLAPGAELEVRHDRRPVFLYPQLEQRGFVHETDEPEPGLVRIRIRRGEA